MSQFANYQQALERRTLEVLADGGRTFEDLLPHLRGAFPSVARFVLDELVSEGRLELADGIFYFPGSREVLPAPSPAQVASSLNGLWSRLPEPHPLYFEWYWDENALHFLGMLQDWTTATVAFLGCPRLFAHYAMTVSRRRMLLIDINERVLATLRGYLPGQAEFIVHNAFLPLPDGLRGQFDVAIMDSPWYLDHTKAWLARAFELLEEGEYTSLFPELTRDTAMAERREVLLIIDKLGLLSEHL